MYPVSFPCGLLHDIIIIVINQLFNCWRSTIKVNNAKITEMIGIQM